MKENDCELEEDHKNSIEKRGTIYSDQSKSAQVATIDGHKLVSMDPAVLFEHQQSCEEIKKNKARIALSKTKIRRRKIQRL